MFIISWHCYCSICITLACFIGRVVHNWSLWHISPLHYLEVGMKALLVEFFFMTKSSSRRVRLHISPLVFHIELFCHLLILTPSKMLSFVLVSIVVFFNIHWLVDLIRSFNSLSKSCQLDLLRIILLSFLYLRFYWTCRLQWNWSLDAKIIPTHGNTPWCKCSVIVLEHSGSTDSPWCIVWNLSPRISARECLSTMLHPLIQFFFISNAVLHFQNYLYF